VIHSIVPLAVLEAIRNLDTPVEDGLGEFADELLAKRLGLSATVRVQLAEYEALVRRDGRVSPPHVEALLRLVGRRPDADLVFADAGRRVARRVVRRAFIGARLAAQIAPGVIGFWVARGAVRAVLGGELRREARVPVATIRDPLAVRATPDGAACGLYAAAFAELLRLFTGFEGAMLHTACRAGGADRCEWRAALPDPRHH
jgi:predicted hydrocarbon binding protein